MNPADGAVSRACRRGQPPGGRTRVVHARLWLPEVVQLQALALSSGIKVNKYLAELIRAHFIDLGIVVGTATGQEITPPSP